VTRDEIDDNDEVNPDDPDGILKADRDAEIEAHASKKKKGWPCEHWTGFGWANPKYRGNDAPV
jgi:hypothetical protein